MSRRNQRTAEPEQPPAEKPVERTDYTRAGGHVLTDMGWMPEEQVKETGATRSTVSE